VVINHLNIVNLVHILIQVMHHVNNVMLTAIQTLVKLNVPHVQLTVMLVLVHHHEVIVNVMMDIGVHGQLVVHVIRMVKMVVLLTIQMVIVHHISHHVIVTVMINVHQYMVTHVKLIVGHSCLVKRSHQHQVYVQKVNQHVQRRHQQVNVHGLLINVYLMVGKMLM